MAGRAGAIFKRSPPLKKTTDQIKQLNQLMSSKLIEHEHEVAKEMFAWACTEPNTNLEMVFSCMADLTEAYTECMKEQCEKLHEFREAFKAIIRKESELREMKHKLREADRAVNDLHVKVAKESRNRNTDKKEAHFKATCQELEDAIQAAATGRTELQESKGEFDRFKAATLRNALISFNSGNINVLSNMLMITQTKMAISEMLNTIPITCKEELQQKLSNGNRLVKEVYDKLNLELPMREADCDRWQIHRNKYTIRACPNMPEMTSRSAPSSPTQSRAHTAYRPTTPPPKMPPPQMYTDQSDDDFIDTFSSDEETNYSFYGRHTTKKVSDVSADSAGYIKVEINPPASSHPVATVFPTGYAEPMPSASLHPSRSPLKPNALKPTPPPKKPVPERSNDDSFGESAQSSSSPMKPPPPPKKPVPDRSNHDSSGEHPSATGFPSGYPSSAQSTQQHLSPPLTKKAFKPPPPPKKPIPDLTTDDSIGDPVYTKPEKTSKQVPNGVANIHSRVEHNMPGNNRSPRSPPPSRHNYENEHMPSSPTYRTRRDQDYYDDDEIYSVPPD